MALCSFDDVNINVKLTETFIKLPFALLFSKRSINKPKQIKYKIEELFHLFGCPQIFLFSAFDLMWRGNIVDNEIALHPFRIRCE